MIMTCTNCLVMLVCSDMCLVGITNQNSPEMDGLVVDMSGARRAEIIAYVMRLKSSLESEVRSTLAASPAAKDVPRHLMSWRSLFLLILLPLETCWLSNLT